MHVAAPAVVLATGGCGRLYRKTTNFRGSTGMGYAMALEAGADLVDMEFVSFEPTVSIAPERAFGMELPTMAFSDGARLLNGKGESFVSTKPPASKDVMSRAIVREVTEGRGSPAGGAFFDMREMDPDAATSYWQIRRLLRMLEVSPADAAVEVSPAQHYLMGGIRTDEHAATRVPGLFAVGEAAGGTHGAHRLATCGGTEVISMGAIAGEAAAQYSREHRRSEAGGDSPAEAPGLLEPESDDADTLTFDAIRDALEQGCGVLRNGADLERTTSTLRSIHESLSRAGRLKTFVGRGALVATAIATTAARREESRGDHFRTDFPHRDDRRWLGNHVCALGSDGELSVAFHRIGECPDAA